MRAFMRVLAAFSFVLLTFSAAGAQETLSDENLETWNALATRTQTALENDVVSDDTLDQLRGEIVAYRKDFDAARETNAPRIVLLRDQLALLGPEPTEGEPAEAADIAQERAALNQELSALLRPGQRAQTAFVLADGLVSQIDQRVRERQTEALLHLNTTPLNPQVWQPAGGDLIRSATAMWYERADRRASIGWQELRQNAAGVILSGIIGVVLILRGRRWAHRITGHLQSYGLRGFTIWRFVVSLLRVVLPYLGLLALVYCARLTGYFGPRGDGVLAAIPALGGMLLGFRWLAEQVFSRDEGEAHILLPEGSRANARFCVFFLTIMIAVTEILNAVLRSGNADDASFGVIGLPSFLLSAMALFGLGRLMARYHEDALSDDTDAPRNPTFGRIVRGAGRAAMAVACISAVAMLVGYVNLANAMLPPLVLSLALLSLVMVLQRFLSDLYGAISGRGAAAADSLLSVMIGLVLAALSIPLLALIWGARVTDLSEVWSGFMRGFSIGETQVSPTDFVTFAVIFAIGYVLTRLIQGALRSSVLPKTRMDAGGQNAVVSGLGYIGIILACILAFSGAGIDLTSLAFVAGALSLGIGFGLQNIVSNFVSGVILLIERPISEGDWIEVGGQMGYVRNISVRSTRIETFDRTDVIVPNADLVSGTVTNYTRGNTVGRVIVPIGVAYGTDTKRVEAILREIAEAQPMVLANPAPSILFVNFGADSLDFEIRCFLRDVNWMMKVKNDINHAIAARFVEEDIEIPFAQRDLWLRNPETLVPTKKGKA